MARTPMITLGGDLPVGRIGYGAMRLTGPNLWGNYVDRDGGIALLRQAVEAGVTLIDPRTRCRTIRAACPSAARPPRGQLPAGSERRQSGEVRESREVQAFG